MPLKISAALSAGAERIIIPKANMRCEFDSYNAEIIAVSDIHEVIEAAFGRKNTKKTRGNTAISENIGIISAEGVDISK